MPTVVLFMPEPRRIYLDNAATSWPKPPEVYAAVEHAMRDVGAGAGRGAYREALQAEELVWGARRLIARLIGAQDERQVVFTSNGTDSLNLAIHGMVRRGGHVVTTAAEHNSVLRPLTWLQSQGQIELSIVPVDARGVVDPANMASQMRKNTCLVAVTHASNVTGAIQPVADVRRMVGSEVPLLVDVAQTLGELELDVNALGADFLAAPGHKGLLGPLGTGVLFVSPRVAERVLPLRQGGTGSNSDELLPPKQWPQRMEVGNLNVPAIAGLRAGVEYVRGRTASAIHGDTTSLANWLIAQLQAIEGLTLHGPPADEFRMPIVSFSLAGIDPQEVAAALDSGWRIQVRAGLHCAGQIHTVLGTWRAGGTVRASIGPFNDSSDIDELVSAVRQLASSVAPTSA